MSREIPQVVRAVVGLAATVLDDTLQLPRTLPSLPVRVIGLAMQATMKLQQHYSGLVARGDEVFTGLRGESEPGLATFDEDLPQQTPGRTSAFDRAPGFDQPTSFDRASVPVDDEEVAEEVAALIDDEVSGLPDEPAPEEVVEALADITDEVAAAGLEIDRAEAGLTTEDALETALLEADGAPDSALVDGGSGEVGVVDSDEIAESPTPPPASLLEAEATEFDVHPSATAEAPVPSDPGGSPVGEEGGAPDVTTEVDVLTPDGGVATVEGTVTDEGVAAPEAPAEETAGAPAEETAAAPAEETPGAPAQADRQDTGVDEALGSEASDADTRPSTEAAPAGDDHEATGSGDEVVTAAGAQVDDELGGGEDVSAPAATDETGTTGAGTDEVVATDESGTDVAAATGVRTDVEESATADEAGDTTGAPAAGTAPVEGYDGFTIAQLRGRLRGYQLSTVADLVAYEEATRAREPYLRMLRNRLEKLERQAVEDSPLAPAASEGKPPPPPWKHPVLPTPRRLRAVPGRGPRQDAAREPPGAAPRSVGTVWHARAVTSPSTPEAPWPVRTVARKVAEWIGRLGEVWVEGQIAQLSRRGAATVFLTLRDPAADLSVPVTCSRDVADRPGLELTEGARVIVRARPDYYIARGSFSLRATEIRAVGLGELLARIERIRRLLAAEGLFDAARKRPLPFAPAVVGVVTGRDSAAERDVLVTARRRWPAVRFAVHHSLVQGPSAAASVIDGLQRLDRDPEVEVIVIARGGGSVEDLLPFSDEGLVRAIAACRTPVVTAVGHETDTTLVDHAADVRAATPTDAAHRVVPEIGEQRRLVDGLRARARHLVGARLEQQERWLESVRSRPVLADPQRLLHGRADDVEQLRTRARRTLVHRLEGAERDLEHARARVAALSPAATLQRGYAVVQRGDGSLVRNPGEVADDERLSVRVAGGRLPVRVDRQDEAS